MSLETYIMFFCWTQKMMFWKMLMLRFDTGKVNGEWGGQAPHNGKKHLNVIWSKQLLWYIPNIIYFNELKDIMQYLPSEKQIY